MRTNAIRIDKLTGRHCLLYLLPRAWRDRILARFIRQARPNWDFEKVPLYVLTPWGVYFEISSARGRVHYRKPPAAILTAPGPQ